MPIISKRLQDKGLENSIQPRIRKTSVQNKKRIDKEISNEKISEIINKELKKEYPVKERYSIWDVMVAWRDSILDSSFLRVTKRDYLSRMQKLIEEGVINPSIKLKSVNESWLDECSKRIYETSWSEKTKKSRKTCLLSFYKFSQTFDPDYANEYEVLSYRYIPTPHEIKNRFNIENSKKLLLSSAHELLLNRGLNIQELYDTLKKHNQRDAWIIALMIETGCSLDEILEIKKTDISPVYIKIKNFQYAVDSTLIHHIKTICKEFSEYVFTTKKGEKVGRVQVTRNLKRAGHEVGLTFDLTPMIFHRHINKILIRDKRSPLEKLLC